MDDPYIFAPDPSDLLLGCNKHAPVSLEDIKDAVHEMNGENRIERQGSNSQGDIFQIQSPLFEPVELRIRLSFWRIRVLIMPGSGNGALIIDGNSEHVTHA